MTNDNLIHSEITTDVIGAFFEVYNELGFGFLEYVYSQALEKEIRALGRTVEREDAKFYRLVHTNPRERSAESHESAESASPDFGDGTKP